MKSEVHLLIDVICFRSLSFFFSYQSLVWQPLALRGGEEVKITSTNITFRSTGILIIQKVKGGSQSKYGERNRLARYYQVSSKACSCKREIGFKSFRCFEPIYQADSRLSERFGVVGGRGEGRESPGKDLPVYKVNATETGRKDWPSSGPKLLNLVSCLTFSGQTIMHQIHCQLVTLLVCV